MPLVQSGAVAVFSQLARTIGGFISLLRTHGDNNAKALWPEEEHTFHPQLLLTSVMSNVINPRGIKCT